MTTIAKYQWHHRAANATMTKPVTGHSRDRRGHSHRWTHQEFLNLENLDTDEELSAKIDLAMLNLALVRIKNHEPVRLPTLRRDIRSMIDDVDFENCTREDITLYFQLSYINQWFGYEVLPKRPIYDTLNSPSDINVYIRDWFQPRLDHAIDFTVKQLSKVGLIDPNSRVDNNDPKYAEFTVTDSINIQ